MRSHMHLLALGQEQREHHFTRAIAVRVHVAIETLDRSDERIFDVLLARTKLTPHLFDAREGRGNQTNKDCL